MESIFTIETLWMGLMVFSARVIDVSAGTIRTISTVHGRMKTAFVLGVVEVSIWILIVSKMITEISDRPILVVFYALGFSTGNVLGILVERRIAFGHVGLRIISRKNGIELVEKIREAGYAVTTFEGQGKAGPVMELYIVCRRKLLKTLLNLSKAIDPEAFFTTENVSSVRHAMHAMPHQPSGWRAILKKK